jgi:hypothetical protein
LSISSTPPGTECCDSEFERLDDRYQDDRLAVVSQQPKLSRQAVNPWQRQVESYLPSQFDQTDEDLFRYFEILLCSEGDYKVSAGN